MIGIFRTSAKTGSLALSLSGSELRTQVVKHILNTPQHNFCFRKL